MKKIFQNNNYNHNKNKKCETVKVYQIIEIVKSFKIPNYLFHIFTIIINFG